VNEQIMKELIIAAGKRCILAWISDIKTVFVTRTSYISNIFIVNEQIRKEVIIAARKRSRLAWKSDIKTVFVTLTSYITSIFVYRSNQ
jgi:hypothetical protein